MTEPTQYNYKKKKYLISKKESAFMHLLQEAVSDRYLVFPQIHIDSIVEHHIKKQDWQGALAHIQRKSVDFILCNKEDYSIVCAIELDDPSHEREDRKKRDIEVERIFEQANIPLIRFEDKTEFGVEEIKRNIENSIGS